MIFKKNILPLDGMQAISIINDGICVFCRNPVDYNNIPKDKLEEHIRVGCCSKCFKTVYNQY